MGQEIASIAEGQDQLIEKIKPEIVQIGKDKQELDKKLIKLEKELEKSTIDPHWKNHPLAKLLASKEEEKGFVEKVTDFLMGNFLDDIDKLKKKKKEIKGKDEKEFYKISQSYYSSLLIRIIEVVGEKQHALRFSPKEILNTENRTSLQGDIDILNQYFDRYMVKYKKANTAPISIMSLTEKVIFKSHIKPENLLHQKRYADAGYVMGKEIHKFLHITKVSGDTDFPQFVKDKIAGFIKWADTHPATAANMVGNIALTCSIIEDKSLIDQMGNAIKSRAYALAFLDAFGLCQADEMIEDEQSLEFRALADLMIYAPWAAAGLKIVQHHFEANSIREWIFQVGKTVIKTKISKEVLAIIPPDHDQFVALAIDVAKGTEMQQILAYQRNLALIRIAGAVRKTLKDPGGTLTYLRRELDIWWKTIWTAQGAERQLRIIVQLGLPSVGALASTAALVAGACGVIFSMMNALIFALVVSIASITLARLIATWINEQEEYKGTLEKINNEDIQQFIATKKNHEIEHEVESYISDLQKRCGLPLIPQKFDIDSPKEEKIVHQLVEHYRKELLKPTHKVDEVEDCIAVFNQVIDLKKMKEEVNAKIEADEIDKFKVNTIVFKVADELMKDWLVKNLNRTFQKRLLEFYSKTEEGYNKELKQENSVLLKNPDEFLEEQIKEKNGVITRPNTKEISEIFDRFAKMSKVHASI